MNFLKFYVLNLLTTVTIVVAVAAVGYVYLNKQVEVATELVQQTSAKALDQIEKAKETARAELDQRINVAKTNIDLAKVQATEHIRTAMDEQMARASDQLKEGAEQAKGKVQNLLEVGKHTFFKPNTEN